MALSAIFFRRIGDYFCHGLRLLGGNQPQFYKRSLMDRSRRQLTTSARYHDAIRFEALGRVSIPHASIPSFDRLRCGASIIKDLEARQARPVRELLAENDPQLQAMDDEIAALRADILP